MDLEQLNNRIIHLTEQMERYKKQRNKYKTTLVDEQNQKGELEAISEILGEKLTEEKDKNKKLLEKIEKYKSENFSDLNFSYNRIMKGYIGDNCPICMEKFENVKTMTLLTNCSHCFCTGCIDKWGKDCPVCKSCNNKYISN